MRHYYFFQIFLTQRRAQPVPGSQLVETSERKRAREKKKKKKTERVLRRWFFLALAFFRSSPPTESLEQASECQDFRRRHDHIQRFPKTYEDVPNNSEPSLCVAKHDLVPSVFNPLEIIIHSFYMDFSFPALV